MSDGTSPMEVMPAAKSAENEDLAKTKEVIKAKFLIIYNQMVKGCSREFCTNPHCCSCPYAERLSSAKETAERALKLVQDKTAEFCSQSERPPRSLDREFIQTALKEFSVPLPSPSEAQQAILARLQEVFGDMTALAISFRRHSEITSDFLVASPDFDAEAISALVELCNKNKIFHERILQAVKEMADKKWRKELDGKDDIESALNIRRFLLILELPGCYNCFAFSDTFHRLLYKALSPSSRVVETLIRWITEYDTDRFLRLVRNMHDELAKQIAYSREEPAMKRLCNILDLLYKSNRRKRRVSYKEFYNDTVNNDFEYKKREIRKWYSNKTSGTAKFTVYDYAWMLNPESKYLMLSIESDIQQDEARGYSNSQDLFRMLLQSPDALSPYCVIEVRRENLIEDALNILSNTKLNFKKGLKVKFVGEQGVDAGGVTKEFFQLIVRQLFNPSYGMLNYNEETHTYWFNQVTYEPRIKFELMGFVIGLALYNTVILDIHFPRVVYKKLLGLEYTFDDLADYSPSIAQSLEFILKYEGADLQEVLGCTFSVDLESFGVHSVVELIPSGSSIYVTQQNKHEYVRLYMDWLFEKSIAPLFESFKKGFYKLYSGEFTTNCDPDELQLLICGSPVLDFKELEKNTKYDGGYTKDSPTVKNLWTVLDEFDVEQKKRFLFFTTGSDRAPVGGLGSMSFIVMKHGEDNDQLPSAHTCFNHLLLPPYKTKEKLREKLLIALNNSEGFGLLQPPPQHPSPYNYCRTSVFERICSRITNSTRIQNYEDQYFLNYVSSSSSSRPNCNKAKQIMSHISIVALSLLLVSCLCSSISSTLRRRQRPTHNSFLATQRVLSLAMARNFLALNELVEFLRNRDMVEYYGEIAVGSQRQIMNVVFDTGSEALWLPVKGCRQCHTESLYDPSTSQSFKDLSQPSTVEYQLGAVRGSMCEDSVVMAGAEVRNVRFLCVLADADLEVCSARFLTFALQGTFASGVLVSEYLGLSRDLTSALTQILD